MVFRKKKKNEAEELKRRLAELEGEPEEPKKNKNKIRKMGVRKKQKKVFSLNEQEMNLAINALARSEEFKLYQQMVLGQQIAGIITQYNQVVSGKLDLQETEEEPDEESDEETEETGEEPDEEDDELPTD